VGGRFGQDYKIQVKLPDSFWASFWNRTIALQNYPIRVSSKWRKNSSNWKFCPA